MITFYAAQVLPLACPGWLTAVLQVELIQQTFQRSDVQNVKVGTVDGFQASNPLHAAPALLATSCVITEQNVVQGGESDVVIVSFVRAGDRTGFLNDFRRLNVAITRAKRVLWMVLVASQLHTVSVQYGGAGGFRKDHEC